MIEGQQVRAWYAAALTGAAFVGKLPKLDPRLLGTPTPPKQQPWQELKAAMRLLTATAGEAA